MDLNEGLWSGLPFELIERVLSFLPVLDLCRLRSVCKRWNELLCKPTFHNLCEQNKNENAYLFVTRHLDYGDWSAIDPTFKRTTSFLDLNARRWYSLKPVESGAAQNDERISQSLAMDDGLVCETTTNPNVAVAFAISDPVARSRKELPESPVYCHPEEALAHPLIVTAVDNGSRSYKVFVISDNDEQETRLFVYESSTNEWRGLKNPPEALGLRSVVSAVCFGGILYVIFRLFPGGKFLLLSYKLQEDAWKLFNLRIPKKKRPPQLVVSCNRLFIMMWTTEPCLSTPEQIKFNLLFEVKEILVTENTSRMVVQLARTQLQQMFGEEDVDFDIAYTVPCINSSGFCKSLVLMSLLTGKLISYDLASGSVAPLPAHPTVPPAVEEDFDFPLVYYQGKYTNLSLRNLSSPFLE